MRGLSALFLPIVLIFSGCETESRRPGMVVSTHHLASEVGAQILRDGGNGVDAAVAVSFALAVVYPQAGNIGGGGFMVLRDNAGLETAIDFRETAPAAAHRDMYLDKKGNVIRGKSLVGALAVGTPGSVAGMLYALEKYGTMDRREVLEPAIKLAREGFILERKIGGVKFSRFESTDKVFNKPDGSPHQIGDRLVQPELAEALERIAERGNAGFYEGKTADLIVATMQKHGGLITHEDLHSYRPVERAPVKGSYKGYEIISMPPPSSGGVCLIQILNMLEQYDLEFLGQQSAQTMHLMAEAERRAYADRAIYLGDPDFVQVPVEALIGKEYAKKRAESIDLASATASEKVKGGLRRHECCETTHYSIVDSDGMAVSVTTTLNGAYGSYLVCEGAGFLFNNEMDDFSAKPGEPNLYGLVGFEANAIEPNKRMLSSMAPTIVAKDGKNVMVIGSPGGSTIITTVLQCILNVVEHNMPIQEAVDAGRFHHQWLPDRIKYELGKIDLEALVELRQKGHHLKPVRKIGVAQGIWIDPETRELAGGADPRSVTSSAAHARPASHEADR